MPRTEVIERTVFSFDELDDKAKARARQEFVDGAHGYPYDEWWSEDDFVECARLLGIEIDKHRTSRKDHMIYFELHRQGAGASFEGEYRPNPTAVADITAHAPNDKELLRIATELTALQVGTKLAWNDTLEATITCSGNSCHSMTMNVQVDAIDRETVLPNRRPGADGDDTFRTEEEEQALTKLMRDFADWIYGEVQKQYDHYFEDETIDGELEDREFNADGSAA